MTGAAALRDLRAWLFAPLPDHPRVFRHATPGRPPSSARGEKIIRAWQAEIAASR